MGHVNVSQSCGCSMVFRNLDDDDDEILGISVFEGLRSEFGVRTVLYVAAIKTAGCFLLLQRDSESLRPAPVGFFSR